MTGTELDREAIGGLCWHEALRSQRTHQYRQQSQGEGCRGGFQELRGGDVPSHGLCGSYIAQCGQMPVFRTIFLQGKVQTGGRSGLD